MSQGTFWGSSEEHARAKATGELVFDLPLLARGLGFPEADVIEHFQDGRSATPLFERKLLISRCWRSQREHGGGLKLYMPNSTSAWEGRTLTRNGVAFSRSKARGVGREFETGDFEGRFDELAGYVVFDAAGFPRVSYWLVPVARIEAWWKEGSLGSEANIDRAKALYLFASLSGGP